MNKRNTELHLFDDPKSKIRFLELALGKSEWKASLHFPPFDPKGRQDVGNIEQELRAKGFKVSRQQRRDGYIILNVHHLGSTPDIPGLFKEHGITSGASHVIRHPIASAGALIDGIGHGLKYGKEYVSDPARANGLIFLTGEAFLIMAASGNIHGKWYHPKNFLQGAAGTLWASQSAAYLFWAKKGDERITDDLAKQLDKNGDTNFEDLRQAPALNARPINGWVDKAKRTLEDHPIQSGAVMNNLGMLSYMAHAVLERRYRMNILKSNPNDKQAFDYVTNGFLWAMGGSLISILGWSSLLVPPKEYKEKSDNVIERLWQTYRENPQALTAFTSLLSSSSRLKEALSPGKTNTLQAIGEGIYIPGDILLFFVKNHDYGASRHGDYDGLLDKISKVIHAMPMVAGEAARTSLYASTAEYLARQHYALAHQNEEIPAEKLSEESTVIEKGLRERCDAELAQRHDLMIGAARRLVHQFPAEQQLSIGKALASALPSLHGLHTESQALDAALCLTQPEEINDHKSEPTIDQLAPVVGQLAATIPGPYLSENVMKLYEALTPHLAVPPKDNKEIEQTFVALAESVSPDMEKSESWAQLATRSSPHLHSASSR